MSWILERIRLQNSPYFCAFKYARAVKQKVWNEAENRERDWGETLSACEARARKSLTPRFTDFFTDFEKKSDCFSVYPSAKSQGKISRMLDSTSKDFVDSGMWIAPCIPFYYAHAR